MHEQNDRILTFKKNIGFDDVAEAGEPDEAVAVIWPRPDTAIPLIDQGWNLSSAAVRHWESGAWAQWNLVKGEDSILLRIFVSSLGSEPARQLLLNIASMTTTLEIPYRKCSRPLGTLSTYARYGDGGDYLWSFRNVCVNAETGADIDIYAFATWIQSIAESGVVEDLSSHLPQIKSVEFDDALGDNASPTVRVGETFSARVILETDEAPDLTYYSFEFLYDNKTLKWKGGKANVAKLSARCPGNVEITVQVIDRKTLLSSWQTVKVTAKE